MSEIDNIQPPNLQVRLYPHQKASVVNMEKLEKFKRFTIENRYSCETEFGILGDIPGYGKSYSIIALLLRDKMEWDCNQEYVKNDVRVFNDSVRIIQPSIKKRIKTNLIVCPVSVMKQWSEYLSKAPSLSVFEISTRKHIHNFEVGKHDVVLLNSTKFNEVIDIAGENTVWKRFIFDEAASITIPSMRNINFGFMWLVTATYDYIYSIKGNGHNFLRNFIRSIPYNFLEHFVVKNNDDFIRESFYMPPVETIIHQCINPRVLSILRNHIDDETHTMISAGNIKGAITKLGGNIFSTTNLIEIVKKRKAEKITACQQSLEFWEKRDNKKESDQWRERLVTLEAEMREIEDKYKNMLKDDCSICYDQLTNHTMVSCCQNIFCGNCIMKWLQMNHNTCPLCRHVIKPIDLSFIKNENDNEDDKKKLKNKKDVVIDIINNCVAMNRKVILFSSYDETFDIIRTQLYKNKIEFAELSGHRSVRESKLENFMKGELSVIFLNSRFNGAGINLQIADDIILYHKMSEGLRKQVLGRALRIGRTDPLLVHEFNDEA
jgi:SNF2 family DNA or RNA helicase